MILDEDIMSSILLVKDWAIINKQKGMLQSICMNNSYFKSIFNWIKVFYQAIAVRNKRIFFYLARVVFRDRVSDVGIVGNSIEYRDLLFDCTKNY